MLEVAIIFVLLFVLVLGDIAWLEITEAIWNVRQRIPMFVDKRRHPKKVHRYYR